MVQDLLTFLLTHFMFADDAQCGPMRLRIDNASGIKLAVVSAACWALAVAKVFSLNRMLVCRETSVVPMAHVRAARKSPSKNNKVAQPSFRCTEEFGSTVRVAM